MTTFAHLTIRKAGTQRIAAIDGLTDPLLVFCGDEMQGLLPLKRVIGNTTGKVWELVEEQEKQSLLFHHRLALHRIKSELREMQR